MLEVCRGPKKAGRARPRRSDKLPNLLGSGRTGIGEGVLKNMLPIVAAMMMGTMSKQVSRPAGSQAGLPAGAESLIGMLTPVLDSNRDGSIVDDVVGMIGRFSGRQSI